MNDKHNDTCTVYHLRMDNLILSEFYSTDKKKMKLLSEPNIIFVATQFIYSILLLYIKYFFLVCLKNVVAQRVK